MNKLFTKIAGLSIGLAMAIGVGVAVASNSEAVPVHASPETGFTSATMTAGTNGSSCTVNNYSGIKVGTSSKGGDMSITVPSGATKLVLYAAAWKGVTGLSLNITKTSGASSATISSSSISLTADTGISNSSPFTLSGTESNYRFELTLTNITAETIYKFASSTTKRFVVWSAQTKAAETKVTATYISTYGTLSKSSEQVNSGGSISMPTISNKPSTHEFEGFSDGTNTFAEGATTTISANTTFTAQWVEIKELTSIALSGTYPISFDQGASFSHEGMVVTAHFGDSTSADVTSNATWSGYDMSTAGNQTVTVSYTLAGVTKTATYGITVNALPQYELITSAAGLETGAKYVIGNANGTKFLSTTQNNNNRSAHTLVGTIVDDVVTYETGMEVIELGGSAGAWTLEATAGTGGALGYLYAASSSSNYLRTQESSSTWTITFSGTTPTLTSQYNSYTHNILKNNGDLFSCYASGQTDVSLYKLVDTSESIAISKSSVSGLKTDLDTSVSITAKNFTPTNIEVSYSTAGVATVTKGTIDDGIIPLNVAFNTAGTTTASITVKGGTQDYSVDLVINVSAKPASMTVVHSDIVAGHLEIQTGEHKQVSFSGLDTDGEPYAIAASDVTGSVESGSSYVSLSGTRINTTTAGTAVVRYTLKALTSVYAEVTVDVVDDYKTSVSSITLNSNLTATQGDEVDTSEVFATKVANTHFGSTATITDSELLFAYDNDRSEAVAINMFAYDFSHGSEVDSTHKLQTVYVFVTFDENYAGTSFSITVTQKNDPLTAITLTNSEIADDEVDLARGSSLQLTWALTPTNPTDGRELQFSVDDNDEGVKVSVSDVGLISVAADSGLGAAAILVEAVHNTSIYTYLYVNVTLESMSYQVNEEASYHKITTAAELVTGDYLIVYENDDESVVMDGGADTIDAVASKITGVSASDGAIKATSTLNAATFHYDATATTLYSSSGKYMGKTADSNGIDTNASTQYTNTITFSDGNAIIAGSGGAVLRYNSSDARFRYYKSSTYTNQKAVTLYLKSGGLSTKDVDVTLFNAIHNNFGEEKTYEWDEVCASFKSANWTSAGSAVTSISGFANYKLNRAVANANGNEIEQFLAKYDIIIGKTSTDYDFLGRFSSGGINYNTRIDVNPIQLSAKNTSAVIIIVVISSISIAAVGGYFLFRRRKEQ